MAEVEPKPKGSAIAGDVDHDDHDVAAGSAPAIQGSSARHREALGAWWAGYKAGRDGVAPPDAVPGIREDPDQWAVEQAETAASFSDLLVLVTHAADDWFDRAKGEEPPSDWLLGLEIFVSIVAGATLSGLASQATALVLEHHQAAQDLIVGTLLRTGMNAVEGAIREVVGRAAEDGEGDPHAALRTFCRAQARVMQKAAVASRASFRTRTSGTRSQQRVTIAELRGIRAANERTGNGVQRLVDREMLLGWAALLAGDTQAAPPGDDIEDIDHVGVLRLTVGGEGDRPTRITSARIDGLNPALRGALTGRRLGELRPGRADDTGHLAMQLSHGIDVLISTGSDVFRASPATWERLVDEGLVPQGALRSQRLRFSVFVERTGKAYWIDDDLDWTTESSGGADAGRYFVRYIRGPLELLADLDEIALPEVER